MGNTVGIDSNRNQGLDFYLIDILQNRQNLPNV